MPDVVRISPGRIDSTIERYVGVPFTDESTLVELGIDSLSALRIVTALADDGDREIDLADLVEVRTVGQFRRWLRGRVTR